MTFFGWTVARTKQLMAVQALSAWRTWWPFSVFESSPGAWQRNEVLSLDVSLSNPTLYACISLISQDIGKTDLRLMALDEDGVWNEVENPAFSPFLRQPNEYQTTGKFIEWWMTSKLTHGNTYVLKERDQRGVVIAGYVLDPCRVRVLIAPDRSVFYQLDADQLTVKESVVVPAREIIHDPMCPLFHPLLGVSPIFAAAFPVLLAKKLLENAEKFFANSAHPGGIIKVPGGITQETADRVKEVWETKFGGDNAGKVAVLADGMAYEPTKAANAVDLQLIEILRWTDEQIAKVFHMPLFKVGGPMPPYAAVDAVNIVYYSDCLQALMKALEDALDKGLGLSPDKINGVRYGVEFNRDDLFLMDSAALIKSEKDANGLKTVNESRKRLGLPNITGGDTVYRQQQDFSIEALNRRDSAQPAPSSTAPSSPQAPADGADAADTGISGAALQLELHKALVERLTRAA